MNASSFPHAATSVAHPRPVERLVAGRADRDGDGVKVTRVLTQDLQRRLDPLLMFGAFGSDKAEDYIGGFPDHPHRGFETVTYMVAGSMRHRDSAGNEGLVANGGVQWMTAGRGVVHSELPEQEEGRMEGFQLWLNLAAKDKLVPAAYRDIPREQIPEWEGEGAVVRVIAGESHGVAGAVQREVTEPIYLDIALGRGARFEQLLPAGHNALVYVYRGEMSIGTTRVGVQRMAILGNEGGEADGVVLDAGDAPVRALLIAGKPLNEPIAQYGPFVMNSNDEILQAVEDFRAGRLA